MTAPAVGIFWGIVVPPAPPVLLADLMPLDRAEPYGDALTHGGHAEHWEALAALGAAGLRARALPAAPLWSDYEDWPRGRVVLHRPSGRFTIFADRRLHRPAWIARIVARFGLPEAGYDLRGDPHYVSPREA